MLTILPAPSLDYSRTRGIKRITIEDPIHWEVAAYRPKKPHYAFVEDFVFSEIRHYFVGENNLLREEEPIS